MAIDTFLPVRRVTRDAGALRACLRPSVERRERRLDGSAQRCFVSLQGARRVQLGELRQNTVARLLTTACAKRPESALTES